MKRQRIVLSLAIVWFREMSSAFYVTAGDSSSTSDYSASSSSSKRLKLFELSAAAADDHDHSYGKLEPGRLEELKQIEAELSAQLAAVRREKLSALRSRPLKIGIVGFGRFGQFIAQTFAKHATVVATSRSDYAELAEGLGVTYVPLSDPAAFLAHDLDVIVFAVSILSFRSTLEEFAPILEQDLRRRKEMSREGVRVLGPLIVDVLSVKEHARKVMIESLPEECDILCTHPMFGPDSGKHGWNSLNFVYEKTRIDKILLDAAPGQTGDKDQLKEASGGKMHSVHEDSEAHVEGVDRMERFLSIWEEEGCRMVPMSCKEHDAYAANSQFITHLIGRVLGSQGLAETPIDTSGFQSVLKLVGSTTADSFDLFYGLYKYNENSLETITKLQEAMNKVVSKLHAQEEQEQQLKSAECVNVQMAVQEAEQAGHTKRTGS